MVPNLLKEFYEIDCTFMIQFLLINDTMNAIEAPGRIAHLVKCATRPGTKVHKFSPGLFLYYLPDCRFPSVFHHYIINARR